LALSAWEKEGFRLEIGVRHLGERLAERQL
jgi:hypothetical protein